MIKIGVIGASGYTGGELLRLLYNHSNVEISFVTSRKYLNKSVSSVHPHIRDTNLVFKDVEPDDMDVDLVFTATPHGTSMNIVPDILNQNIKIIDLSGDYRYENIKIYEEWYGIKHENPLSAVYGLPEIYKKDIKNADLIANPGCFPTGAILASYPLVKEGLVDNILFDSKTGISGAGINPTKISHFPIASDNIIPYKVTKHRHLSEIKEKLNKVNPVNVSFTPHLVPIIRGILTTAHIFLKDIEDIDSDVLEKIYINNYNDSSFVKVLHDEMPLLSSVKGSNFAHIGCFEIDDMKRVVIISAIDNLVKGASGQAIHNMNIMFDFDEMESLRFMGLHP